MCEVNLKQVHTWIQSRNSWNLKTVYSHFLHEVKTWSGGVIESTSSVTCWWKCSLYSPPSHIPLLWLVILCVHAWVHVPVCFIFMVRSKTKHNEHPYVWNVPYKSSFPWLDSTQCPTVLNLVNCDLMWGTIMLRKQRDPTTRMVPTEEFSPETHAEKKPNGFIGPQPELHDARGKLGLSIHLAVWLQNQVIAQSSSAVRRGQSTVWAQGLNILGQTLIL